LSPPQYQIVHWENAGSQSLLRDLCRSFIYTDLHLKFNVYNLVNESCNLCKRYHCILLKTIINEFPLHTTAYCISHIICIMYYLSYNFKFPTFIYRFIDLFYTKYDTIHFFPVYLNRERWEKIALSLCGWCP